jgi:hypothetical protein
MSTTVGASPASKLVVRQGFWVQPAISKSINSPRLHHGKYLWEYLGRWQWLRTPFNASCSTIKPRLFRSRHEWRSERASSLADFALVTNDEASEHQASLISLSSRATDRASIKPRVFRSRCEWRREQASSLAYFALVTIDVASEHQASLISLSSRVTEWAKQRVPVTWIYPEKQRVTMPDRIRSLRAPAKTNHDAGARYKAFWMGQRLRRNTRVGWWDLRTPTQNKCPRTRRCTVLTPLEYIRHQQCGPTPTGNLLCAYAQTMFATSLFFRTTKPKPGWVNYHI